MLGSSIENIVRIKIKNGTSEVAASRQEAERVKKLCQQNGLWTLQDKDGKYPDEIKPVVEIFTQGHRNGGVTVEPYASEKKSQPEEEIFMKLTSGDKQVIAFRDMIAIVEKMRELGRTCVLKGPDGKIPGLIASIINVLDFGEKNDGVKRNELTREEILIQNSGVIVEL